MDWRFNTIWFDLIDKDKLLNFDFNAINQAPKEHLRDIQYFIAWHHKSKEKNLVNLPSADDLQYLELNWSNSTTLRGINKYKKLKRLELHMMTKLESGIGLESISETLEFLHIDGAKKLNINEQLAALKNLKVLRLHSCGDIDNLDFLQHLPNLVSFRFMDTNITNGDIEPILNHPSLSDVCFINKRHFNLKNDAVDDILKIKNKTADIIQVEDQQNGSDSKRTTFAYSCLNK